MNKKIRSLSMTTKLLLLALIACGTYIVYVSYTFYYPAPFDTPSNRKVTLVNTSSQSPEYNPSIEREDMIYFVDFTLYVSVDGILNPNQSENVCLLPHLTGQLRLNARMTGTQLTNLTGFAEQLLRRGEIRVDGQILISSPYDGGLHFTSGARNAVYLCLNTSNLATGLYTIEFESSLDTGEHYSLWWEILIEE